MGSYTVKETCKVNCEPTSKERTIHGKIKNIILSGFSKTDIKIKKIKNRIYFDCPFDGHEEANIKWTIKEKVARSKKEIAKNYPPKWKSMFIPTNKKTYIDISDSQWVDGEYLVVLELTINKKTYEKRTMFNINSENITLKLTELMIELQKIIRNKGEKNKRGYIYIDNNSKLSIKKHITINSYQQNNMLAYYNKSAKVLKCIGMCHGYESSDELEDDFNIRMMKMLNTGYAGKGHRLSYRETLWWWQNGYRKPLIMDGDLLTPIRLSIKIPAINQAPFGYPAIVHLHTRYMASPFWYIDDLKVHGSVALNDKNNKIYDGIYDFDHQENIAFYNLLGQVRNALNDQAIIEHEEGQPFWINYKYD